MSAGCLSNVCSFSSAPYKMIINDSDHYNHTQNPIQKQGFLSILNTATPDFNFLSSSLISYPPPNYSIRRTFSADMLALNQNGFSLKRAQSSEQLDFLGNNDDDHDHQEMNKNSSFSDEKRGAFEDIWSSIQKNGGSGSGSGAGSGDLPPPYVHPLVRKSASLLSQRSLEICTESLGSETGSETGLDGLSYPASDPGGSDKDGEGHAHQEQEESTVIKINCAVIEDDYQQVGTTKFLSIRRTSSSPPAVVPMARSSFPPPLPSLSHRAGSNLHMRSHRRDGRLVVEAVAVPSVNRLRAQRHDGRLLLTLTAEDDKAEDEPTIDDDRDDDDSSDGGEQQALLDEHGPEKQNDDHADEDEEGEEDDEEEEEEEEEETELEKELAIVMEAKTTSFKTSPSSSLLMSKLMELMSTKNKSAWPRDFNATIVKTLEDGATLTKSHLPPRPVRLVSATPVTTNTSTVLNAYEYYWRRGRGNTVAVLKPLAAQKNNTSPALAGPQVVQDAYRNKLLLAHKGKPQEGGVVVLKAGDGVQVEKEGLKAGEYLVPLLRGCKEPRKKRSLLFWDSEPYCIATS